MLLLLLLLISTSPCPCLASLLPALAALETAHNSLQQRLNEAVLELDAARVAKAQAEAEFEVSRGDLQQRVAEAERRGKALAEQRDVLQQQLEKAAAETPGEGAPPPLSGCYCCCVGASENV